MITEVYTLNAFTKQGSGGNPAGVVLDSDKLTNQQMKLIAKKVGYSETAFVQQSNVADYKIRYFTAVEEVDLCGHATIATFHILKEQGLSKGVYTIETKAGILEVSIEESIFLTQTLPRFGKILESDDIVQSLNIDHDDLDKNLPIQIVSTGLRDILIPIKNREILNQIEPDFNEIKRISNNYNVVGYHLFTLDSEPNIVASCRNFAPLFEIAEESATGTSNGALTCYLHTYNIIGGGQFVMEQGVAMNATSEIRTRLEVQNKVTKIEVGGEASKVQIKRVLLDGGEYD